MKHGLLALLALLFVTFAACRPALLFATYCDADAPDCPSGSVCEPGNPSICVPSSTSGDGDGAPPDGGGSEPDGGSLDGGMNGDGDGDGDGAPPDGGGSEPDGGSLDGGMNGDGDGDGDGDGQVVWDYELLGRQIMPSVGPLLMTASGPLTGAPVLEAMVAITAEAQGASCPNGPPIPYLELGGGVLQVHAEFTGPCWIDVEVVITRTDDIPVPAYNLRMTALPADWAEISYETRRRAQPGAASVAAPFPWLVRVEENDAPLGPSALVFIDGQRVPFDIEREPSVDGVGLVWVQRPDSTQAPSSPIDIYTNPLPNTGQAPNDPASVWTDTGYIFVTHFNPSPSNPTLWPYDVVSGQAPLGGSVFTFRSVACLGLDLGDCGTTAAGSPGGGIVFDLGTDLAASPGLTFSVWHVGHAYSEDYQVLNVVAAYGLGSVASRTGIFHDAEPNTYGQPGYLFDAWDQAISVQRGAFWPTELYDPNTPRFLAGQISYASTLNDAIVATVDTVSAGGGGFWSASAFTNEPLHLVIGNVFSVDDPFPLEGAFDELRISRDVRDAAWLQAERDNILSPSVLEAAQSAQHYPAPVSP